MAQRVLGLDVSRWQGTITQSNWNTVFSTGNRKFVFIRASRGGTTGEYHAGGGYPVGDNTFFNLSQRYDDPYFVQFINNSTTAGLFAGPYHFARPDIIASTANSGGIPNNGTDEANHFMQMAGAWMRPGYLLPVYDFEAGDGIRTDNELSQFSIDFSNRIYEVMGIRPAVYINGNYAHNVVGQSTNPTPSQVVAAYPTLWTARWPQGSGNPYTGDIQTEQPKDTVSTVYGAWDDPPNATHPWAFWQYSSGEAIPGLTDTTVDGDVAQGDIEFVKDYLVPAIWMNDNSGDWSTLANWNSGQTPTAPVSSPGQLTPSATGPLPTPRLPGAAGSGPTSGQHDTVVLDRPSANITVTVSTGTHNVRKLFVRESLNITGGSLTVNYDPLYYLIADPDYDTNPDYPNALHSGPLSAQFSGDVSLSGSGSLSVNTLQVDATRTFTLGGGTLTFKKINLMPDSTTPAKIVVTGSVTINPLANATATIANGAGAGNTGFIDLGGGTRTFSVGNGTADVDLSVAAPITNGGLTKTGLGTMRLDAANTFAGPVTISSGTLRLGDASGLSSSSIVTVNNGGRLEMNGVSDTIAALSSAVGNTTGVLQQDAASLTVAADSGTNFYYGTVSGTGTFTKSGAAIQALVGNNTLGAVNVDAGSLLFHGTNTTETVTVNGGTLGGSGSVSGSVVVNNNAHLAPGASIESLGVGSLTLNSGSILDIELGTPGTSDFIDVTGALALNGGSMILTDVGGMGAGTYNLIDYATLSGSVANLGAPTGPAGYNYNLIDTGSLIQLSVTAIPVGVPGDFNDDGTVDGADYVLWRKVNGTVYDLPNDDNIVGPVGAAHYALWLNHFGETESGSGGQNGAVPEPSAAALAVLGLIGFVAGRRRR
ncbi:MAG: autotransporter-associated beta strand repeat-containing protein [Planctomycetes bacterium]|nr:autotransporter-associated beta strand repeat-containing protein [Planctomycetota bacterium]